MDLIRTIPLEVENFPNQQWRTSNLPNHSQAAVCYNVQMAQEAGLLEARVHPTVAHFVVSRLTYQGHEFLDAARDHTRWAKAKDTVLNSAGALTLEALKIALGALMKEAITDGV
ncbi:MAG: DUF2513 domain-containing protein [Acidobacteriia bacterium]|nr:DUF2513 domain-containing protein [Terriglobia bacterium]